MTRLVMKLNFKDAAKRILEEAARPLGHTGDRGENRYMKPMRAYSCKPASTLADLEIGLLRNRKEEKI